MQDREHMDGLLELQNVRLRGLGDVAETSWFEVEKNISYLCVPHGFNTQGFLKALQAINPPFDPEEHQIFKDYPLITRQGKYKKRVRPHRRTISFAIFIAQPQLVQTLGSITPHLYEADRIEVGRRLDYTSWINFVEIASSTRWSEIQREIRGLAERYPHTLPADLTATMDSLTATDRIKSEKMQVFSDWLEKLLVTVSQEMEKSVNDVRFAVERHRHFTRAKRYVSSILPRFIVVDRRFSKNSDSTASDQSLFATVKDSLERIIYEREESKRQNSIFLINEHDFKGGREFCLMLRQYASEISEKHQCLYLVDHLLEDLPSTNGYLKIDDLVQ